MKFADSRFDRLPLSSVRDLPAQHPLCIAFAKLGVVRSFISFNVLPSIEVYPVLSRVVLLLLGCWQSFALTAAEPPGAELYQQSKQLLVQSPGRVIEHFQQISTQLPQAPAWYQRDWYLLAARAYAATNLFEQARRLLLQADALVPLGLTASDIALSAGYVTYLQQYRHSARDWFLCADTFSHPPESRAKLLLNLGTVESFGGNFKSALQYYQQGLALAEQHQFEPLIAMYQNNLGNLYWRLGQYEAAIMALRQALFRYAGLKNINSQSKAGINLLNVLTTIEDWARYQRFYPSIASAVKHAEHTEFATMLLILEAVRQRLSASTITLSDAALKAQMASLKSVNLQYMAQLLANKIKLNWQAPAVPVEPVDVKLTLPHTELLCRDNQR